jgi:hypothetical protein
MHKLRSVLLSVLIGPALIVGCSSKDDGNTDPFIAPNDGSVSTVSGAGATDNAVSLVDTAALQTELDSFSGGTRNAEPIAVNEGDTVASILARARAVQ